MVLLVLASTSCSNPRLWHNERKGWYYHLVSDREKDYERGEGSYYALRTKEGDIGLVQQTEAPLATRSTVKVKLLCMAEDYLDVGLDGWGVTLQPITLEGYPGNLSGCLARYDNHEPRDPSLQEATVGDQDMVYITLDVGQDDGIVAYDPFRFRASEFTCEITSVTDDRSVCVGDALTDEEGVGGKRKARPLPARGDVAYKDLGAGDEERFARADRPRGVRKKVWITAGVGAGGALLGGATLGAALGYRGWHDLRTRQELEQAIASGEGTDEELAEYRATLDRITERAEARAQPFLLVGASLLGAGSATLATGLVWYLVDRKRQKDGKPSRARKVDVGVDVQPSGGSVSMGVRF